MISDKYLFSGWGDGTNYYIFRMDKEGTILRADIDGTVYYPIALSDVPQPVIVNFMNSSRMLWQEHPRDPDVTPSWGRQENADDTGLTDDEFIDLILERIPGAKFENGKFYIKTEVNKVWIYRKMPDYTLRQFAKNNKYFGNTYFNIPREY